MEARRLYEEVVAGQTAQLGPAHSDTLQTKGNLAILFKEIGELADERRLYEEVVAGRTAQLGPGHVDTLNSKAALAAVLVRQHEEVEAAAALIEPVIESLMRLISPHRVRVSCLLISAHLHLVLLCRRPHNAMTRVTGPGTSAGRRRQCKARLGSGGSGGSGERPLGLDRSELDGLRHHTSP